MTKPVVITTKRGIKLKAYYDESRQFLYTQAVAVEFAKEIGWTWEEQEEQLREVKNDT